MKIHSFQTQKLREMFNPVATLNMGSKEWNFAVYQLLDEIVTVLQVASYDQSKEEEERE